jgi:hypothetical protein
MMTSVACRFVARPAPRYRTALRSQGSIVAANCTIIPSCNVDTGIRWKSSRPDLHRAHETDLLNSLLKYTAVAEWFVKLRVRAANMLTESMSPPERQELLQRLKLPSTPTENEKKDVNTAMNHSIAEAVAAARAQEIKLNQERWEREKEKLIRDAEAAARERIESDLVLQKRRIAFEEWKKQLVCTEEEKQAKQVEAVAAVDGSAAENLDAVPPMLEEQLPPHPILGPCLLDLGYKRLHVVKAQSLAAIPVWEKQRIYRHDRAKMMAADKLKTMHLGMPGVIGLYEHSDGQLSILDGQHRVGMFTILEGLKKDSRTSFLDRIVVEVYSNEEAEAASAPPSTESDSNHAKEIFLEINKAEPVKLVDIPGIVKGSERKILNEAVQQLHDEFREMFRPSTKCHPPHLNIDNVRDALFAANVIGRHKIKSSSQLMDWLVQQNHLLAAKYNSTNPKDSSDTNGISAKILEKAIKNQFYLGLESTWYYN